VNPAPYFGYGMHGWGHPGFFGFGCFGPLLAVFLFFAALRAFGFLFWGHRWGHMHHHGGWGHGDAPAFFKDWHDRAHGEPDPDRRKD
jgi:hypothetical protein